jgi:hypothetical protein
MMAARCNTAFERLLIKDVAPHQECEPPFQRKDMGHRFA